MLSEGHRRRMNREGPAPLEWDECRAHLRDATGRPHNPEQPPEHSENASASLLRARIVVPAAVWVMASRLQGADSSAYMLTLTNGSPFLGIMSAPGGSRHKSRMGDFGVRP